LLESKNALRTQQLSKNKINAYRTRQLLESKIAHKTRTTGKQKCLEGVTTVKKQIGSLHNKVMSLVAVFDWQSLPKKKKTKTHRQ